MDHETILGMSHESVLVPRAHALERSRMPTRRPVDERNPFRLHEGSNVVSGCKYIIRSDVLYTLPLAKP